MSSDSETESSEIFVDEVWFDIVKYVSNSNDQVQSYYSQHRWLECLTVHRPLDTALNMQHEFRAAHTEFLLKPGDFITHIESVSDLLRIRDLSRLTLYEIDFRLWENLYRNIRKLLAQESESLEDPGTAAMNEDYVSQEKYLAVGTSNPQVLHETLEEAGSFSIIYNWKPSFNPSRHRYSYEKFTRKLPEMRLNNLRGILHTMFRDRIKLEEISDKLRFWSSIPLPLSREHSIFQSNICHFAERLTGEKSLQYKTAIKALRNLGHDRYEQTKVLYDAIEKQQTQIALQQKIITCLEYRHVLEKLPYLVSTMHSPPRSNQGLAGAWKKTWRLAVECEIDELIRHHIIPSSVGSVTTESAGGDIVDGIARGQDPWASTMPEARKSLKKLLEFDFRNWAKGSKELKEDKGIKSVVEWKEHKKQKKQRMTATLTAPLMPQELTISSTLESKDSEVDGITNTADVPEGQIVTNIGAASEPAKRPPKEKPQTTGNFLFVDHYRPDYQSWPSVRRGEDLYHDLSRNIHEYGKTFDAYETNFSEADIRIFKWLKPEPGDVSAETEEVDWKKAWENRGLR